MADLIALNANLADAQAAYHKLATGSLQVQVDHGDMRTTWTQADLGKLKGYIDDLKGQIVGAGGTVDGLLRRSIVVNL